MSDLNVTFSIAVPTSGDVVIVANIVGATTAVGLNPPLLSRNRPR